MGEQKHYTLGRNPYVLTYMGILQYLLEQSCNTQYKQGCKYH